MSNGCLKYYTGVGSRETPVHIQNIMTEIGEILERRKFILRTGYAIGADQAFGKKVNERNKEVYNTDDAIIKGVVLPQYDKYDLDFAEQMVKQYHPVHRSLKGSARQLIARNTFQIFGLGKINVNSSFVVCYTQDGAEATTSQDTGGTGQAIRLAYEYGIPVYNLKNYIGVSAQEMVDFILNDL